MAAQGKTQNLGLTISGHGADGHDTTQTSQFDLDLNMEIIDAAFGGLEASTWFSGHGVPSSAIGEDGNFYLNLNNFDVYYKTGGVWTHIGNLVAPVTSVAGKTGAVTLVEGDITGLVTDLASKATVTALNSEISRAEAAESAAIATGGPNQIVATPNGGSGVAGLRAMVAQDVPDISATYQATTGKDATSGYAGLDSTTFLKCPELPPWLIEGVNNSIVAGPVDGAGNPNYTSTATISTVATLTVNGNVTNLEAYIDGQYQRVVDQLLTVVLTNGGGATTPQANFVYLKKKAGTLNLTASEIGVTTNAFVFGNNQTAPSTTLATLGNPVYWFDPTVNKWKKATSNGGAFSVDPIIPLCVAVVDNTGVQLGIGYWGPRWTPWKIMELCGQGTDGSANIQNGTTTLNTFKNYTSLVVSGGTITSAVNVSANNAGIQILSQAPIVVCGNGSINTNGKGNGGGTAGTTTGIAPNSTNSIGGPSGGGGGSVAAGGGAGSAGANGAGNFAWYGFGGFPGGAGGIAGNTYTLTQVGVVGAITTYTGSGIPAAGLAGANVIIAGFTISGNNGTFVVVSSTATTIVVTTTTQANETHAGTAKTAGVGANGPAGTQFQQANSPTLCGMKYFFGLNGRGGGGGAGDGGASTGGPGGAGAASVWLTAPGIVVASGSSITANGANGTAGSGTNGGGGGGGGGCNMIFYYGYYSNSGTVTMNGGTGGAGAGAGQAGGNGAAAWLMNQRIF